MIILLDVTSIFRKCDRNWNYFLILLRYAPQSVQASRSYGFEPMPREQRRFIYELLEVYRCTGQSYDQEPKRNIVVTAYKWVFNYAVTALSWFYNHCILGTVYYILMLWQSLRYLWYHSDQYRVPL